MCYIIEVEIKFVLLSVGFKLISLSLYQVIYRDSVEHRV